MLAYSLYSWNLMWISISGFESLGAANLLKILSCRRRRRMAGSLHQPYYERDQPGQHEKRKRYNHHRPASVADGAYVSAYHSCAIAPHRPAYGRNVTANLSSALESHIAPQRSQIAANLPARFNDYVSIERKDVARNMPTHIDRAIEACHVTGIIVRAHSYVVIQLKSLGVGSYRKAGNHDYGDQCRKSKNAGHKASWDAAGRIHVINVKPGGTTATTRIIQGFWNPSFSARSPGWGNRVKPGRPEWRGDCR